MGAQIDIANLAICMSSRKQYFKAENNLHSNVVSENFVHNVEVIITVNH